MDIFPSSLPDDVAADPYRGSEVMVYNALKSISRSWIGLYSVPWLEKQSQGRVREGEADFVLLGTDIGIVTIEVKGGNIERNEAGWWSIDRHGAPHPIRNPAEQAQNAKHQIRRLLTDRLAINKSTRFSHAVCLPHVLRRDFKSTPEMPGEIVITSDEIGEIEKRIMSLTHWFDPSGSGLPKDLISKAMAALKPNVKLITRWASIYHQQIPIIADLTDRQNQVLAAVSTNKIIGITGPAGCGKTICAIHWARKQASLGKMIGAFLPHSLLKDYYHTLLEKSLGIFSHHVDLLKILATKFDGIIIDEAQDFPLSQWDVIESILAKNSKCKLLALYDSNQRMIKKGEFYLPDSLVEVALTRVIRSTKQIGIASHVFYRNENGLDVDFAGPEGPSVTLVASLGLEAQRAEIQKIVKDAVFEHGFDYGDVVVLTGSKDERKDLVRLGSAKDNEVSFRGIGNWWEKGHGIPIVSCGSVRMFRGMESPVIILTGLDDLLSSESLEACYVGMSRAKFLLYVVANPETLALIKKSSKD